MKRVTKMLVGSLAAITILTGAGLGANVAVSGVSKVNYNFVINDKKVSLPSDYLVMSKNNTTYVPLRFLSEQTGATVDYQSGTISISTPPTTTTSQPADTNRIKELEDQIAKLQKENKELTSRIDSINASISYKKLPVIQNTANGLSIRLRDVSKTSAGIELSVEFVNEADYRFFKVDSMKTKMIVDGKEYFAGEETEIKLNQSLNMKNDRVYGNIIIKGLESANVKGSVVFSIRDNGVDGESLTLFFDNTK